MDVCAGGLDTLAMIADRGKSDRAKASAMKVKALLSPFNDSLHIIAHHRYLIIP